MKRGRPSGWQLGIQHCLQIPTGPAEFDLLLSQLGIAENEAAWNPTVRMWVRENYRDHFVPEGILTAVGVYEDSL